MAEGNASWRDRSASCGRGKRCAQAGSNPDIGALFCCHPPSRHFCSDFLRAPAQEMSGVGALISEKAALPEIRATLAATKSCCVSLFASMRKGRPTLAGFVCVLCIVGTTIGFAQMFFTDDRVRVRHILRPGAERASCASRDDVLDERRQLCQTGRSLLLCWLCSNKRVHACAWKHTNNVCTHACMNAYKHAYVGRQQIRICVPARPRLGVLCAQPARRENLARPTGRVQQFLVSAQPTRPGRGVLQDVRAHVCRRCRQLPQQQGHVSGSQRHCEGLAAREWPALPASDCWCRGHPACLARNR